MRWLYWLCYSLLVLSAVACGDDDADRPLNQQERKIVSQLYADSVRTLTPIVDSLCTANRDALVAQLADSIYAERVLDIQRQRQRFGNAEQ